MRKSTLVTVVIVILILVTFYPIIFLSGTRKLPSPVSIPGLAGTRSEPTRARTLPDPVQEIPKPAKVWINPNPPAREVEIDGNDNNLPPAERFEILKKITDNNQRRLKVKQAFKYAWDKYEQYAWGQDELLPLDKSGRNWAAPDIPLGFTIVDALDTAYIMGLQTEFDKGRQWILDKLLVNLPLLDHCIVSTFETTIRILGGLLSIYSLTGEQDTQILSKAEILADRLLGAFVSSPHADGSNPKAQLLPRSTVNLGRKTGHHASWLSNRVPLAEVGTLQLEFSYLAKHTRNANYSTQVAHIIDVIDEQSKPDSLYSCYLDLHSAAILTSDGKVSLGGLSDSYYEYLLKMWLLTNKKIPKYERMYSESVEGIFNHMIATSPDNQYYISDLRDVNSKAKTHVMDHLACFAGGMLALGGNEKKKGSGGAGDGGGSASKKEINMGEEITSTCHDSYKMTKTGLGPEQMEWRGGKLSVRVGSYILRPETVESYMVLWRVTGDERYREWGWEAFCAMERWCRTEGGYSGLRSVDEVGGGANWDNLQQSFFLAETLKYLYLLFSDNDVVSLDEYVFNTEAHPFKIFKEPAGEWLKYMGSDKLY
eukprot:TRINITY_DN7715_c0_g1_i1.p1 TRINITY_DN7715_c0_g1~~TRINITY_DN7715_c0_g1_i1.p1  ORF type:complete len:596 (-),score=92.44 TRINITY_DN7715_c0_g1_i1:84-1871(-)